MAVSQIKKAPFDIATFPAYANLRSNIDMNDLTASGLYRMQGGLTNNPGGNNYGIVVVLITSLPNCRQIFLAEGSSNIYTRVNYSGVWSPWYLITASSI